MLKNLLLIAATLMTSSCLPKTQVLYSDVTTYSDDGLLQMIVEIPAGTNKKLEYNSTTNAFPADVLSGGERTINFLPYPGNYGFIPSTIMNRATGGDGDALDVLLLSQHIATGTILEIIPIGILGLEDNGENDSKIIAVPVDENLRVIDVVTYRDFYSEFGQAKHLIELWFLNYKGNRAMQLKGWGDEIAAKKAIEASLIKR
jgi:inorganic pyrophosphatase